MLGLLHDGQQGVRGDAVSGDIYPDTLPTGITADYKARLPDGTHEDGIVLLPAAGERDWTGKRPYLTPDGVVLYLFDDEVQSVIF